MSTRTRIALAVSGVIVLVVAAILLTGDTDTANDTDDSPPTGQTTPTGATGATESSDGDDHTDQDRPKETEPGDDSGGTRPQADDGGAGVEADGPLLRAGSVKEISVSNGETVRFRARSDSADELHIHGYDKYVKLPPGKTATYSFKANIEGVFEIELHGTGEIVAELRVTP
ncbi:MAG: hypothetical protein WAP35_07845 [Solirubrobacterales bacterium]